MRHKTVFVLEIGEDKYPIYLVSDDIGFDKKIYNLECEKEIPAVIWSEVYRKSIKEYEASSNKREGG